MNVSRKSHRTVKLIDLGGGQVFTETPDQTALVYVKSHGQVGDDVRAVSAVRLEDGLDLRFSDPLQRVYTYDANLVLTALLGRDDDSS